MNRFVAVLAAMLVAATPAFAQAPKGSDKDQPAGSGYSQGEVRKIDKDAGKITLKHGPIANLEMPPMTMVFRVKDPTMLDKVKAGDAISFKAEKVEGNFTVTELGPAK